MSERSFVITEEMMRGAKSYLPITAKEAIIHNAMPGCIRRIFDFDYKRGAYATEKDDLPTTMPYYGEDTAYKSRVMMGCILHFYLGIDIGEFISITPDEYDRYAESHPMNQIERFKTVAEFKSKAFDMLSDIRDLEKRMNCAIYSMLQMKNDGAARIMAALGTMMSQEALESVIGSVKEAQDAINNEREKQDAFIDSLDAQEEKTDA